jgi:hypothetical protein
MILTEFLLKNKNSPINVKNNFTRLPTIFLHVYLRIVKKKYIYKKLAINSGKGINSSFAKL